MRSAARAVGGGRPAAVPEGSGSRWYSCPARGRRAPQWRGWSPSPREGSPPSVNRRARPISAALVSALGQSAPRLQERPPRRRGGGSGGTRTGPGPRGPGPGWVGTWGGSEAGNAGRHAARAALKQVRRDWSQCWDSSPPPPGPPVLGGQAGHEAVQLTQFHLHRLAVGTLGNRSTMQEVLYTLYLSLFVGSGVTFLQHYSRNVEEPPNVSGGSTRGSWRPPVTSAARGRPGRVRSEHSGRAGPPLDLVFQLCPFADGADVLKEEQSGG